MLLGSAGFVFGFGAFVVAMVVLGVFIVRFSVRLTRERSRGKDARP